MDIKNAKQFVLENYEDAYFDLSRKAIRAKAGNFCVTWVAKDYDDEEQAWIAAKDAIQGRKNSFKQMQNKVIAELDGENE